MTKLKSIYLKNYCGFRDIEFNFTTNGTINPISMFIGPNGIGKSSILNAIQLLSSASKHYGRETTLMFRKITYDPNYDPAIQEYMIELANQQFDRDEQGRIISVKDGVLPTEDPEFLKKIMGDLEKMEISSVWQTDDGDKKVVIRTDGVVKDELYQGGANSFHYFIDADNPGNNVKFQLEEEKKDLFIELAEAIYGYKCYFEESKLVNGNDDKLEECMFYVDFILEKPWGDKIHFKRMSAGEKKIATLIRGLCDPTYMAEYDLILIDNIAMHIYSKRHKILMNKLLEVFPDKQFIVTTHSGILPSYVPPEYVFDVEAYKIEESKKLGIELKYPDIQASDNSIGALNRYERDPNSECVVL